MVDWIGGGKSIVNIPFGVDVAEGDQSNVESWSKIGYHAAVGTDEIDMMPWAAGTARYGLTYTFPNNATSMVICSTSANDVNATGWGAWGAGVKYLDAGYNENYATVALNGVTSVTVATNIFRIQNVHVVNAGTSNIAIGNLTVGTKEQTYGYITATKTRMRQCIWTVPYGKVLYVSQIFFSCAQQAASKMVRFTTRANYNTAAKMVLKRGLFMPFHEIALNNTGLSVPLDPPTPLPATTDIKVSAIADSAAIATCALRGWVKTDI